MYNKYRFSSGKNVMFKVNITNIFQMNFSQILILVLKFSKRISPAILSLSFYSPWTRGQIGTKLGTKYVMYQQLANFVLKKDIYVNRLESVNFGIQMCILQIRM